MVGYALNTNVGFTAEPASSVTAQPLRWGAFATLGNSFPDKCYQVTVPCLLG